MKLNTRGIGQLKEGLNYADIDGVPTGFTLVRRKVFEEIKVPQPEEWSPFGTGDFAWCERIKAKWYVRLVRDVYAYHLYMNKKGEVIVYGWNIRNLLPRPQNPDGETT